MNPLHRRAGVRLAGVLLTLLAIGLLAVACAPTTAPAAGNAPAPTAATVSATEAPAATATAPAPPATEAADTSAAPAVAVSKTVTLPSGVTSDGHFYQGDPNAPVKLVEYSEFQCPYCSRHFLETEPSIDATYVATGKVQVIFHNFPLEFHPNAMPAAKAAYCAGQQSPALFWKLHDWLFNTQATWSAEQDASATLRKQAVALGADGTKYDACVKDAKTQAFIQADIDAGTKAGVQGTPAFFVNDWFVNGAQPYSEFQKTIEQALQGLHPAPTPTPLPQGANFFDLQPNQTALTYDNSPSMGDGKANLVLVAFSDLKCADCATFATKVWPSLRDKYVKAGKLRMVYEFDVTDGPKAAEAGICAARQGKFWELADLLYAHQSEWKDGDTAAMTSYAKTAGLDTAKFTDCLNDKTVANQVENAAKFAQDVGVPQVPAFLLIDVKEQKAVAAFVGSQPLSDFESKIEEGLNPPTPTPAAAATQAPAGTPAPTATK
jgi:protein-disulfide isomerase